MDVFDFKSCDITSQVSDNKYPLLCSIRPMNGSVAFNLNKRETFYTISSLRSSFLVDLDNNK